MVHGSTSIPIKKTSRCGKEVITAYGRTGACLTLMAWYKMGADAAAYPYTAAENAQLVVVDKLGSLSVYDGGGAPIRLGHRKSAFGDGAPYAYGALAMGATAREAAEIACEFNTLCGYPLDIYHITSEGISYDCFSHPKAT